VHKVSLIVVHGDRTGEAERSLLRMVEQLRLRRPNQRIEGAVLLKHPEALHLEHVLEQFVAQGVSEVSLIPWFLFAGPHVQQDIPEIVSAVLARHPQFCVMLQAPIGLDPVLINLLESKL
jgi:sirohydrochlorin ferrochelatase